MSKLNLGLKQKGQLYKRQNPQREYSRKLVAQRVLKHGSLCEGCGDPLQKSPEWAHLFGRRNIVKEPLASFPELTVGLDRKCHLAIDLEMNVSLRSRLRWDGLERLAERYSIFREVVAKYKEQARGVDDKSSDQLAIACVKAVEVIFNANLEHFTQFSMQ